MPGEAYGQREASRMSKSLADDPDDRNWDVHRARVMDRGSAAIKEPRRSVAPDLCGPRRALLDKVGGSK
jgi:hypothetical protein